jgi:hypothetical protein
MAAMAASADVILRLGAMVPFDCCGCGYTYEDYGPLLAVEAGPEAVLLFCSDACALDAGYADAVDARWRFELVHGDGVAVLFRRA